MQINIGVKHAVYPNGESLADVMTYNHYGTPTIPPRPVLRIAAEKVVSREEIKDALAVFVKNLTAPRSTPISEAEAKQLEKEVLRKIGVQVIKEAKAIIMSGGELQHNAPSTVKQKGFDLPLYGGGENHIMIKNLGFEYED
ncbi:MAG: hypothetical protein WCY05_06735 [Candidatus Omnitrophota bacterium]